MAGSDTASDPDPEKGEGATISETATGLEPSRKLSTSAQSHDSDELSPGELEHDEEKGSGNRANKPEDSSLPQSESNLAEGILGETARSIDGAQTQPTLSRASSARSRNPGIVPRSQRRGFLSRLAIIPEVERPHEYSDATKWAITVVISIATMGAPMGSSIFYPALPALAKDLHTSQTIANLSVSFYMLAMSFLPIFWSALSEHYGRRTIYLISFGFFVVFSVLCGISTNITMLIVFRFGGGGASASVQAVGAGTIADIWESYQRGRAIGFYFLGPLLGPLLAPIFGGALAEAFGWQSTMWYLTCFGFVTWLLILLLLPETLAAPRKVEAPGQGEELQRMTTVESVKVRSKSIAKKLKQFFIDPLAVLLLLRFPPVLITVATAAFAFMALFVGNISIQQNFSSPPYNYQQLIVGLLYIPPGLGYFLASILGGRWIDRIMAREARKANRYDEKGKLILLPEDRMKENMVFAVLVYPLSLLGYGWTVRYGIHFMVPSVFLFLFGCSSMLVFSTAMTMLTEFVSKRSSAGVAVNNFVRNILSCVGTIVAAPWIDAIGSGWVFTILCIWCMTTGIFGIWMLRKNSATWRKVMVEKLEYM